MGAKTEIAWTDSTWTPIRARVKEGPLAGHVGPHCERVSQGCVNCYSETNNGRCLPANGTGLPFNRQSRDKVDIFVDEKILTHPLHWKAARRIFVCSQTDLFGEWVTDEMIDRVFAVMALCPQHTFQVLTKREGRMQAWISAVHGAQRFGDLNEAARDIWAPHRHMFRSSCGISILPTQKHGMVPDNWPLPNVWLGVSCENERTIMERAGLLKQTPAALRFLSLEPLLGPPGRIKLAGISWVIVGGESGPGARPMHLDWVRSVRDQCQSAGVAFFFKQAIIGGKKVSMPVLDGRRHAEVPRP